MFSQLIDDFEQALRRIPTLRDSGLLQAPVVQPVTCPVFSRHDVAVDVLRCDLLHPVISGNKWFKLKYNLLPALRRNVPLASFGGAWSNHLHALAYCAQLTGLASIGYVRGDELDAQANSMLADAKRWGMQLQFLSRQAYRRVAVDVDRKGDHPLCLIPEGGDNWLGVLGCMTMVPAAVACRYDQMVLAMGTGCTFAGLRLGLPVRTRLLGVSVLKGEWPGPRMAQRLQLWPGGNRENYRILTGYHTGGYGRVTPELLSFVADFGDNTGIPLEPVYTGKAMWALCDQVQRGSIPSGSRVLFIHSGGLQGRRGYHSLSE